MKMAKECLFNGKDLIIAVTSTALFNMSAEDAIYRNDGVQAYETHQAEHVNDTLEPGAAYPFITKLLKYNALFTDQSRGVEVIIVSRNSPRTGLRVMNTCEALDMPITRAVFTSGHSPAEYIKTFGVNLFLSTNREDVMATTAMGVPAGCIITMNTAATIDTHPNELRLAFDFDGVLASDSSEAEFQRLLRTTGTVNEALDKYTEFENVHENDPIEAGPLSGLLKGLNAIEEAIGANPDVNVPDVRTSLVTARSTATAARAINTLSAHGMEVDESFMMAGLSKTPMLGTIQPDMYFDDQSKNLDPFTDFTSVHVPFGVCNK